MNQLAHRVLAGPEEVGGGFVDDGDSRGGLAVGRAEIAAAKERYADCLEVSRRGNRRQGHVPFAVVLPLKDQRTGTAHAAEWNVFQIATESTPGTAATRSSADCWNSLLRASLYPWSERLNEMTARFRHRNPDRYGWR